MNLKLVSMDKGARKASARLAMTLVTVVLATVSAKAWALASGQPGGSLSVNERVAALRVKAAELAGRSEQAQLPRATPAQLAQDDKKKWKNE